MTAENPKKVTITLPADSYDRLIELANGTSKKKKDKPFPRTNAIAGQAHPLHPQARIRGVR